MSNKPWDVHPALTEDKLITLADTVKQERNGAVELYEPHNGDGPWSLGCRVYERTINAIEREASKHPWLSFIRRPGLNGLYFVILIDGIPIRFQKGDVDNPQARTLQRHYPELKAEQLAFPYDQSEWFWRLVVETDENGYTLRVVIVQYSQAGDYRNLWEIPIGEPVMAVTTAATSREGVVLPEPSVGPKYNKSKVVGDEKNN